MELEKYIEKFNKIEEQITQNLDLLEIAKNYCDTNFDKGVEVNALGTIIGLILDEQRSIANNFDGILNV